MLVMSGEILNFVKMDDAGRNRYSAPWFSVFENAINQINGNHKKMFTIHALRLLGP